jgi:hypothetical protein
MSSEVEFNLKLLMASTKNSIRFLNSLDRLG